MLELKRLEEFAATGRLGGLHKRERVHPHAIFESVLEVCRIACSKEIRWINEDEAMPDELEARPLRRPKSS